MSKGLLPLASPGRRARILCTTAVLGLFALSGHGQEPTVAKPVVRSQADLPRHSYQLPTPTASALLSDPAFHELAAQVRRDVETLLSSHRIEDRATLRELHGTLESLALLAGDHGEALLYAARIRELQDKPAERLTSGLVTEAVVAAERAGGGEAERQAAFRAAYAEAVAALPWDVVQDSLEATKGRTEIYSRTLLVGIAQSRYDPAAAENGRISGEVARDLVRMRAMIDVVSPYREPLVEILQDAIDSPEAIALKAQLATMEPSEVQPLLEHLGQFMEYLHGTHVAGVAVAGNRAARLLVVRETFPEGKMVPPPITRDVAVRWAANMQRTARYLEQHGVRVVNLSWGLAARDLEAMYEVNGIGASVEERRRLAQEVFDVLMAGMRKAFESAPDILFVAAAGNSDEDIGFTRSIPGAIDLPNVLTVGAVDHAGDQWSDTSYGWTVRAHAKGVQVESYIPGGERLVLSGTSLAALNATNLAGKLFAVDPSLTAVEAVALILEGADRSEDGRRVLIHPKRSVELLRMPSAPPGPGAGSPAAARPPAAGDEEPHTAPLEQVLTRLLQDRYDGRRSDYREFIERTFGETHVFVDEAGSIRRLPKAQVVAYLSNQPGGVPPMPAEVEFSQLVQDVTVRSFGDVALAHYLREMRMVFNGEPVRKRFRCSEVFQRHAGEWQSVAYHETVIPGDIVAATVDPKIYDDYVGRYRLFAGYDYTITRDGDTLMFGSRGAGGRELVPESDTTFVLKGDNSRIIFVRNTEGEITHLRLREFPGVEYNAIRVR